MTSISEIKACLQNSVTGSDLQCFIDTFSGDERAGVIKLVETARKKLDKLTEVRYHWPIMCRVAIVVSIKSIR